MGGDEKDLRGAGGRRNTNNNRLYRKKYFSIKENRKNENAIAPVIEAFP